MKKVKEDANEEPLLASISQVMSTVASMEFEQETFMDLGCYLHRTSPIVMELSEDAPSSAPQFLQSLSAKVDLAKDLVGQCSIRAKSIRDDELKSIIEQLEEVIRMVGQDLSSIPLSTFENKMYTQITVRSLSREMKNVCFRIDGNGKCDSDEHKQKLSTLEKIEKREEDRLHRSWSRNLPCLGDFLEDCYNDSIGYRSEPLEKLSQQSECSEPLYDTFFCPLTKKIMDDPVTIESGITYERKAIVEWFERNKDNPESITCPATDIKLQSRVFNTNIALRTIIAEWKRRNEAKKIKAAHKALLLASSKAMTMILRAIRDLHILSQRRSNREQMHSLGITNLLACLLDHGEMIVRVDALKLLCLLAEEEEGKVAIANTTAIRRSIEMLSSNNSSEKHASVAFLWELTKTETLLEIIGHISGSILTLITMKYNELTDSFAAEKAGKILTNLEKCPINIRSMAEYGYLEPLLDHLVSGSEEVQMEMVRHLSELVLEDDMKSYVAGKATNALIKMVTCGQSITQGAAFRALVQISSHHLNSNILVDAGIIPILTEEAFTPGVIHGRAIDFKEEAATILANIVESKIDLEKILVSKHGHTITSRYSIYNIAHMLKSSKSDKLNMNLIRILISMAKLPQLLSSLVSAIKETEGTCILIEFLNHPVDELTIISAKLLLALSPCIGHTIADVLCKTQGQPEGLVKSYNTDQITEKDAVSVKLIAKLPQQNLTLNLALLRQSAVATVLERMQEILRGQIRTTSHTRCYLEGLVGILIRFTTTLYDQDILAMAREQNLTSVFTELLVRASGSSEVQRLAAVGLENLSSLSVHLSRAPELRNPSRRGFFSKSLIFTSKEKGRAKKVEQLCPVHRGACSSSTTFCLLESRAVERLVGCLEHEEPEVVEAALAAISTLLDERVDVERSVKVLSEADALRHVVGVLRQHRREGVWEKSFWLIEKFLMSGGHRSVSDLSSDRMLPSALVTALHKGSGNTKKLAESILRHLNRIPSSSNPI